MDKPDVLLPGAHYLPGGVYREQGTHQFVEDALAALPEVMHPRLIKPTEMRLLVDKHMSLCTGRGGKLVYRPCSHDHARLILAQLR